MTPRRTVLLLAFIGTASLVARIAVAAALQHPGHADPAFYYSVGLNVARGKGFYVDYVWHYLSGLPGIPHPSTDYWMPLTSLIVAGPLVLAGDSLFVALLPAIISVYVLAAVAYLVSRRWDAEFAAYTAALVVVSPSLSWVSVSTDSTIYYAVFASLCLWCIGQAFTGAPGLFLVAASTAALAHLTRQDGVLLFFVLNVAVAASGLPARAKWRWLIACWSVYLVLLAPLLLFNWYSMGVLLPAGTRRTAFLRAFVDMYAYCHPPDLSSYMNWGLTNIARAKVKAFFRNTVEFSAMVGAVLTSFLVCGVALRIERDRLRTLWPTWLFLGLLWVFYSLVATGVGEWSFKRSSKAVVPLLLPLAVDYVRNLTGRKAGRVLLATVAVVFVFESAGEFRSWMAQEQFFREGLDRVKSVIETDAMKWRAGREIMVMTGDPWNLHYATGFKAVQVPAESRDVIYDVAQHYDASYLVLLVPLDTMRGLYDGTDPDRRFPVVGTVAGSGFKVFRIVPSSDGPGTRPIPCPK